MDNTSLNEEIVSLHEATNRYIGQWFAMRITEKDERRRPKAGVVIGSATSFRRAEALWPEGPEYDPDRGPEYGIFRGRRTPDPESEAANDAAFARGQEISIFDAAHFYHGEWILMRVTRYVRGSLDTIGVVLAHDRRRSIIRPLEWAESDRAERSGERYDVFFGHDYLPNDIDPATIPDIILERELRRGRNGK